MDAHKNRGQSRDTSLILNDTINQNVPIKNTIEDKATPLIISNVQFFEEDRGITPEVSKKLHRTSNNNNAANIFRVKGSSGTERKDRLTYVRYQNYTSARTRKTTEQKIFEINNFVKKLTENINEQDDVPEITQTKFKALKKIIQYYDIKNLDRSQYSNVIKSFGLQIGSMRAEQKGPTFSEDKKNDQKKIRAMSLLNRTTKKLQIRNLDQTFSTFQSTNIGTPGAERELNSQSLRQDRRQAVSLLGSIHVARKQKLKSKSPMKFKFNGGDNCIVEKVNKYREFLFMLNYSNKLYRPLDLEAYPCPLKFHIGKGNNGNLIRSLMRKRFWFEETSQKEAHFVWTQIKNKHLFKKQPSFEVYTNEGPGGKYSKRSPSRIFTLKNQPINRILTAEEARQVQGIQELAKNRNIIFFEDRLKYAPFKFKKEELSFDEIVHNHFPGNGLLGNKKAMFLCLKEYCRLSSQQIFQIVPKTFIISEGLKDPELQAVASYFNEVKKSKKNNFWILKPGEFSNRGNGIQCVNKLQDIKRRVVKCVKENRKGSLIVQQYITRPLLYNGRKFDLRTYMMITCHNSKTKAYWYQDGYVRTSSAFFSLDDVDPYIHLTNDAVQKHADSYSCFEEGNKLSYSELQRYLDTLPAMGRTMDVSNVLIPKMKEIAAMAVKSTWLALNREEKDKNFEIFGLDFMVDDDFRPWLIQINTNPCLELSSPVLERLVPHMIENVLRIGLDTIFPPPDNFSNNFKYSIPQNSLYYNKFELIFDSDRDGPTLKNLYGQGEFFRYLDGLQEDKNEFKAEGQLRNFDEV